MRFYALLISVLVTLSYIHASHLQQVYPGVYLIYNSEYGIHAYNYFSLFNYEFRFNALFIDGHKLPKCDIIDQEHNELALEILRENDDYDETYLRVYKFPDLSAGVHTMVIAYCDERDKNGRARAVAQIEVDVVCEPMQLLFYPGKPPTTCRFITETSRLLDRQKWIGGAFKKS